MEGKFKSFIRRNKLEAKPFQTECFKWCSEIEAQAVQAEAVQAQAVQAEAVQAQQDQAQQDQAQQDQAQQDQAQQDQAQQDQAAEQQTQAKRENVLVYFKHRNPEELKHLQLFLSEKNIKYRLFSYDQRYQEADYIAYLQTCQYGIVLDAHESQGFAIEEALACDVPLLVWNAQTMKQEHGSTYQAIPCTSIPYWDPMCGEYFHTSDELPAAFQTFQTKLASAEYKPRQYILDNLSLEKCAEKFIALI
jgi:transcription-repair coupling factor (superfamily II helicase)